MVNGGVSLNGATLNVILGYHPNAADRYFLIVNDGTDAIGSTFAGLPNGQSRLFAFDGMAHTGWIYYTGDFASNSLVGGNDIVLSFTPVPEPTGILGIALATIATGTILRRRRPRAASVDL